MKQYAEYKDSGIEWIGSAPIEWSICTLKRVVNLKTDKVDFIGQNYMGLENVESHTGRYVKSGSQEVEGLSTSFQRGDVLFGKLRPYLAKCIIPEFSGICSSEFLVLRNFNGASKYLQYFLLSSQVIEAINASTYGAKMPRANWSYIGQMQIPVPPTPVQQSIVAYLDRKTTAIDELIADKQKLVALLQEKRSAVINETVTKGLDDNEVALWRNYRLGDIANYKKGPFGSAITLSMFVEKSVSTFKVYEQKNAISKNAEIGAYYVTENKFNELKGFQVFPHDIIVSCAGTIGECYIIPENAECGIINQALMKITVCDNFYLQYALVVFSIVIKDLSSRYSNGSAIKNIPPFSVLKKHVIKLPTYSRQKEIVSYLDQKTIQIDTLISDINEQIEKLKEYRQAVISEAVTGKVAV